LHDVQDSDSFHAEGSAILNCDTMSMGKKLLMFQRTLMSSSSGKVLQSSEISETSYAMTQLQKSEELNLLHNDVWIKAQFLEL